MAYQIEWKIEYQDSENSFLRTFKCTAPTYFQATERFLSQHPNVWFWRLVR